MNFGFFKNFGKAKASSTVEKVAEILARIDPDTVTEAAILEVEEQLHVISEETARARLEYQKEKSEADEIEALYNKRLAAAEKLNTQLTADPSNTEIQEALDELLTIIEETSTEVNREKQEAIDAKEILDAMESNTSELANQLKSLRETAKKAKNDIVKAEQEKERALRREEQVKVLAGIKKSSSGFSTAMQAMEKAAESARVEADAAKLRGKLLSPEEKKAGNRLIEEAMGNVKVAPSASSLADRLAKLKK